MKRTYLGLIIAALIEVALYSAAQSPSPSGDDSGVFIMNSNAVPVQYTNTAPSSNIWRLPFFAKGYWIYFTAGSGSTTNAASEQLTATFATSPDLVIWTTNRSAREPQGLSTVATGTYTSLLPNGTNLVTSRLFIPMPDKGFLKWLTVENPAGGQSTNYWTNLTAFVMAR